MRWLAGLSAALALLSVAGAARADTLADAIAVAYQSNPTLQSQRAQLREVDEALPQAFSVLGPTADVQVSAGYTQARAGYLSPTQTNDTAAQVSISQPLYLGGRGALGIDAARDQILAAREALRVTEGDVMLSVIQAYCDVVRDSAALDVRSRNLQVLAAQVKENAARMKDGELTLTDLAQAQAQLANEHGLFAAAQGQLQASRASYAAVVGAEPGLLEPPAPLPGLPTGIDDAFALASEANPDLREALMTERRSRAEIEIARTGFRPTISVQGVFGYAGALRPFVDRNFDRTLKGEVVITQPLFTSGLTASQVRAALASNTNDRIQIEVRRRAVVQAVVNAWNQMQTARANIEDQTEQIERAQVAYKGMRIEYKQGLRGTLDVLIAEETLRDAELSLLAAVHDRFVAEATLLRLVGRLEGPDLVPGLPQFDTAANLRAVEVRGEAPWAPIIGRLDGLGAPGAGQRAIDAPPGMIGRPALATAAGPVPPEGLAIQSPETPIPGTTSSTPPPTMQP